MQVRESRSVLPEQAQSLSPLPRVCALSGPGNLTPAFRIIRPKRLSVCCPATTLPRPRRGAIDFDLPCQQEISRFVRRCRPIIKGNRDKDGPARWEQSRVNSPRQCRRDILRSRRLDTPLHERPWKLRGVDIGELGFQSSSRESVAPPLLRAAYATRWR